MDENKTTTSQTSTKVETGTIQTGVIRIDLWKGVAIVFVSVLGSAGASIWGTLSLANTIPFRVEAVETEITSIKKTVEENTKLFMPLDLSQERWNNNNTQHATIERKLDVIETKIDTIRNLIR